MLNILNHAKIMQIQEFKSNLSEMLKMLIGYNNETKITPLTDAGEVRRGESGL